MSDDELKELKAFLDREVERVNSVSFIAHDPVQFPRRFSRLPDIEIAALLSATIAWGNRKMICANCAKMMAIMDNSPVEYLRDGAYEDLPDDLNIHRTFFARNFKYMLRGLKRVYARHGSLNDFAARHDIAASETPAWRLLELMLGQMREANDGLSDPRCLPTNVGSTALKRLNMALRWLVRDDGIVDMGVWSAVTPPRLFIPLDVHVGDTARSLGLITRKSNDKRAVLELTSKLRLMRPDDPVAYDFALFGIGISTGSKGSL